MLEFHDRNANTPCSAFVHDCILQKYTICRLATLLTFCAGSKTTQHKHDLVPVLLCTLQTCSKADLCMRPKGQTARCNVFHVMKRTIFKPLVLQDLQYMLQAIACSPTAHSDRKEPALPWHITLSTWPNYQPKSLQHDKVAFTKVW